MRDKCGKTDFGLSAPQPALINFDRSEDWLLKKRNLDILRDRIVLPPGTLTPAAAGLALKQFEQDMMQAKALHAAAQKPMADMTVSDVGQALRNPNGVETVFIDGGSQLTDIITLVTLDASDNKNKTFKYADRNTYIRNLFNELNESGLNIVWTSKARAVWVGENRVPNLWQPDCHADVPFMVDVNVQLITEPSPEGLQFYGVIGTNAFNPLLVGKRIRDLTWPLLMSLVGQGQEVDG
jgi:hypothetical protein